MNLKNIYFFLIGFTFFFAACSGSQETSENTTSEDEIYIFDEVVDSTSVEEELPIIDNEPIVIDTVETVISRPNEYIVQVGAYTTEERARTFVSENKSIIKWKMMISFSTKVQLWVVQLPPFETRDKAEEVRSRLWTIPTFADAFIVPEE